MKGTRGFTLAEIVVVLAVLGVLAGVAAFGLRDPHRTRIGPMEDARRTVINTGIPLTIEVQLADGSIRPWRLLPDGSAIGDSMVRFTGIPPDGK